MPELDFLTTLGKVIEARRDAPPASSYTAELFAGGRQRLAQKVGEEAVETALAAVAGDRDELLDEAADLVYHLMVLLSEQQLTLADVAATLARRHPA